MLTFLCILATVFCAIGFIGEIAPSLYRLIQHPGTILHFLIQLIFSAVGQGLPAFVIWYLYINYFSIIR